MKALFVISTLLFSLLAISQESGPPHREVSIEESKTNAYIKALKEDNLQKVASYINDLVHFNRHSQYISAFQLMAEHAVSIDAIDIVYSELFRVSDFISHKEAMDIAIEKGKHDKLVRYIGVREPSILYSTDKYGLLPIHKAVRRAQSLDIIKYLAEAHPNVLTTITEKGGRNTPLHLAVLPNMNPSQNTLSSKEKVLYLLSLESPASSSVTMNVRHFPESFDGKKRASTMLNKDHYTPLSLAIATRADFELIKEMYLRRQRLTQRDRENLGEEKFLILRDGLIDEKIDYAVKGIHCSIQAIHEMTQRILNSDSDFSAEYIKELLGDKWYVCRRGGPDISERRSIIQEYKTRVLGEKPPKHFLSDAFTAYEMAITQLKKSQEVSNNSRSAKDSASSEKKEEMKKSKKR